MLDQNHKGHRDYKADSTKYAKVISSLMAGRLLGPDLGPKRIRHYTYENNGVCGVSVIQLIPKDLSVEPTSLAYLRVNEPAGAPTPERPHRILVCLHAQHGGTNPGAPWGVWQSWKLTPDSLHTHVDEFLAALTQHATLN